MNDNFIISLLVTGSVLGVIALTALAYLSRTDDLEDEDGTNQQNDNADDAGPDGR